MSFGQAGRSKRRRAMVPFEAGESVSAKVVLAKPDAKWAVASTEDGRLLVVQVCMNRCLLLLRVHWWVAGRASPSIQWLRSSLGVGLPQGFRSSLGVGFPEGSMRSGRGGGPLSSPSYTRVEV